jgi:transcription termination factor Rho
MSVLDRSALEASPLADLHAIASELSVDGYRRLRRADLIGAILDKQGGGSGSSHDDAETEAADAPEPAKAPARRRSTSGRSTARRPRAAKADAPADDEAAEVDEVGDQAAPEPADEVESRPADEVESRPADEVESRPAADQDDDEAAGSRRRRGRRGGRGRNAREETNGGSSATEQVADRDGEEAKGGSDSDELVEGVVELLANGSGFVRVDPPDPSDEDVYISSAQVKRCELVSGDRIAGPKRAPRRSERFASLIRIETINGRPASELADSIRFDDLPAAFPSERLEFGSDDPTLAAINSLTPFGKGSRVTIVGASRSGKTETLRRVATALAGRDGLTLHLVLAGVRPEEISEWTRNPPAPLPPVAAASFAASEDVQNGAIEPVIDQARRLAARGADAVVLIDTLDGASPSIARKALAAARNLVDGGSVTVIATASEPVGGETTVIALDAALAAIGRIPALDLIASGTMHLDELVGEAGAQEIAKARAETL